MLRADEERRSSLKQFEEARARQKEIGKQVAKAAPDEKAKLIAQTKELSEQVASFKASADTADEQYTTAMWQLSNIVEPQAPEGGEDDYVVMRKVVRSAISQPRASSRKTTSPSARRSPASI
mgnify:CR=1 FL=1